MELFRSGRNTQSYIETFYHFPTIQNISYDPDPWMTLLLWLRPEHVKTVQSKVIGP